MQVEGWDCQIQIGAWFVKYKLGPWARPKAGRLKIQIPGKKWIFLQDLKIHKKR